MIAETKTRLCLVINELVTSLEMHSCNSIFIQVTLILFKVLFVTLYTVEKQMLILQ